MPEETADPANAAKLDRLARYKAAIDREIELMKFESTFEHASLKPIFLLNGGALVAYSTFLVANLKQETVVSFYVLAAAIAWAFGLVLATVATLFLYHSQWFFRRAAARKVEAIEAEQDSDHGSSVKLCEATSFSDKGQKSRTRAKWVIAVSILFFLVGVLLASVAILTPQSQISYNLPSK